MFPKPILDQFDLFEKLSIRYAIFAGTEVALLTQNRKPTDVDIVVHNDDFDKLTNNLPQAKCTIGGVSNIISSDGQDIICTANTLEYTVDTAQFDIMSNCIFKSKDDLCETFFNRFSSEKSDKYFNQQTTYLAS